jgi:hypothetical protein
MAGKFASPEQLELLLVQALKETRPLVEPPRAAGLPARPDLIGLDGEVAGEFTDVTGADRLARGGVTARRAAAVLEAGAGRGLDGRICHAAASLTARSAGPVPGEVRQPGASLAVSRRGDQVLLAAKAGSCISGGACGERGATGDHVRHRLVALAAGRVRR